jgi:hypothetical protein
VTGERNAPVGQTHAEGRGVMRTEATVVAITHPSFVSEGAPNGREPVDDTGRAGRVASYTVSRARGLVRAAPRST